MIKNLPFSAVLIVTLLAPAVVAAQGPHPHYMEAQRNLRYAQALIMPGNRGPSWAQVVRDQRHATDEIYRAIAEVRQAAQMDGRNPNDMPPIDAHWNPHDRLSRAADALTRARAAIAQEEINPAARLVRDRAYHHIDEAQHAILHALSTWH